MGQAEVNKIVTINAAVGIVVAKVVSWTVVGIGEAAEVVPIAAVFAFQNTKAGGIVLREVASCAG